MVEVRRYTPRVVEQAIDPVAARAPTTSLGALADGVDQIGDLFAGWQDDIDTADAEIADATLQEQINDLLYNEQNGYMYAQGGDAIARRSGLEDQFQALYQQTAEGLSPAARNKADRALRARLESARSTANRHAATSRIGYMNQASEARMSAALSAGVYDPSSLSMQEQAINREIGNMADLNGWAPEHAAVERQKRYDMLYGGTIDRMMAVDPQGAARFLAENRDKLSGEMAARLERTLVPLAKEAQGRDLARAALGDMPAYNHRTNVEYSMGPSRPYAPDKPILDVIGKSVEDVLGPGARVVVTSGQEGDLPQHGSNRHGTGNAADVAIYRPDGSRVRASDPDALEIAHAAARNGAKGIGFGNEYMGGDHFHIDLVDPGAGQDHVWASGGKANRASIVAEIQRRAANAERYGDVSALLEISDPVVRDAALHEYNLRVGAATGQRKLDRAQAERAAFDHVEGGGTVDQMPHDVRVALGLSQVNALRSYEERRARQEPITTDPATYLQLRQAQANGTLRDVNLLEYVNDLSPSDLKAFMDEQFQSPDTPKGVAASTLMSTASRAAKAAGLDEAQQAAMQTSLLRWQDQFIAENNRVPTGAEIDQRSNEMLADVVIDAPGLFNKQSDPAFQIDYDGEPADPGDDMTLDTFMDATVRINGTVVTEDTKLLAVQTLATIRGREVLPGEVVDFLIQQGFYD